MKCYTATFKGQYPVGTAAVVIAESEQQATEALHAELLKRGLPQKEDEIWLVEFNPTVPHVIIQCDGGY